MNDLSNWADLTQTEKDLLEWWAWKRTVYPSRLICFKTLCRQSVKHIVCSRPTCYEHYDEAYFLGLKDHGIGTIPCERT